MGLRTSFRDSAAVLMLRETGPSCQVYLVKRHAELRFFGGFWALPGGVRLEETETFAHCAARELFEETGVLVHEWERWVPSTQRVALRVGLLQNEADLAWQSWAREQAAPSSLVPLGAMQTPAFAPVRYNTEFFLYRTPPGTAPNVIPGELSEGEFVDPNQALHEWRQGHRLLVPPVRNLLEMLVEWGPKRFPELARRRLEAYASGRIPPIANSPGVCMVPLLTPTIPPATTTNHYLVGAERLYVVDPGTPYPSEQASLVEFLEERIAAGSRLEGLLLTHQHHDHVGGLLALQRHFSVPVWAHAHTLANLGFEVENARTLADGDRIELGTAPDGSPDWHLQVVWTPGHAAGHLVFLDSRYRTIIGGDLASTVSTIVIEPPEGHLATYLASLHKAIALQPTLFYPAHGPVARDGVALLQGYLAHRAQREACLIDILQQGGAWSPEALVPHVYPALDPRLAILAQHSLLAGLIKLQEEGVAECGQSGWCKR